MGDAGFRESLLASQATVHTLLSCNKLLILVTAIFAGIALLLAGAFGYVLGRLSKAQFPPQVTLYASGPSGSCMKALIAGQLLRIQGLQVSETREPVTLSNGAADTIAADSRQHSVTQDPSENVLQPRLGSKDALRPVPSTYVRVEIHAHTCTCQHCAPAHLRVSAADKRGVVAVL